MIETAIPGPDGERYCWYQCTIKGGRESRDLDAVTLTQVCEKSVSIPVIASGGAGCVEHFYEVFTEIQRSISFASLPS